MTAEQPVPPPAHPLSALTTSELGRYRRQLEAALASPGAQGSAAPGQPGLRGRLAAVLAEQADRARLAAAIGEHDHG
jgi:hypothetical protein